MNGLHRRQQYVEPRMTVSGPLKLWHPGFRFTRLQWGRWAHPHLHTALACRKDVLLRSLSRASVVQSVPLSRSAPGRHLMESAMQRGSKGAQ